MKLKDILNIVMILEWLSGIVILFFSKYSSPLIFLSLTNITLAMAISYYEEKVIPL